MLLLDLCTYMSLCQQWQLQKPEDELTREQLKVVWVRQNTEYSVAHFSLDTYHTKPICFGAQHDNPPDSTVKKTQKQPHE